MKDTELRIGNLVLNDKVENIVANLLSDGCLTLLTKQGNYIKARYELIQGIPLTKEMLLKAGFEKICDNDYRIGLPTGDGVDLSIELQDRNCCLLRKDISGEREFDFCYFNGVDYVHQLQNLYFALTQTELTITK